MQSTKELYEQTLRALSSACRRCPAVAMLNEDLCERCAYHQAIKALESLLTSSEFDIEARPPRGLHYETK